MRRASLLAPLRGTTALPQLACILLLAGCGGSVEPSLPLPPPAAAGRLAMVTQPVGAMSGAALATQPVVQVLDLNGFPFTTEAVAVTATVNGGGRLDGPGPATVVSVNGRATFADLHVTGAGTFTMTFGSTALNTTTSAQFTVTPAPAAALFTVNAPTDGTSGTVLRQSLISVRDAAGGQIADATVPVTASLASGSGTLTGTTTVNAVAGAATFRDLQINRTGTFVIRYSSGALAPAVSPPIKVVGPPVSVHFAEDGPEIITADVSLVPRPTIRDGDSTVITPTLSTISRDPSIARENGGGVVTGVSGGTTVVVTSVVGSPALADSLLIGVVPMASAVLYVTPGRFTVKTDTTLTLRIFVSAPWAGKSIGTGQVELRFDPQQLAFLSITSALPSATFDNEAAALGLLRISFTNMNPPVAFVEIARISMKAGSVAGIAGSLRLNATQLVATDNTDLLPTLLRVNQPLVLR